MKHSGKMLACVVGGLAFCTAAEAVPAITTETTENPYQSIVDRNVFSLKPPPPPADTTSEKKAPALKITLTGITTILGNKRVLMKTAPPPAKPGESPKTDQSYILTEGQREGEIEVIEINDKAGSVKVNNAGIEQTLTFEKDGAKLPSTPAPAAPGAPPGSVPIPGLPVAHPAPQPGGAANPSFQLPNRIPRLPGAASAGSPGGVGSPLSAGGINPAYGSPGFLPGNTATPTLQNSGAGPGNTIQSSSPNQYSLEEQAILIEAARQAGGPAAALLPPTALSPKANLQGEGTPATTAPGQTTTPVFPTFPGRPIAPGPY
jgi:hypothetical protein